MDRLNTSLGKAEVRFTILEDRSKETLQNTVQRDKEIKSRKERLNWNSKDVRLNIEYYIKTYKQKWI